MPTMATSSRRAPDASRARPGRGPADRLATSVHQEGEGLDRRPLQELHDRDVGSERLPDTRNQPQGEERVAAQLEEVVAAPRRLDTPSAASKSGNSRCSAGRARRTNSTSRSGRPVAGAGSARGRPCRSALTGSASSQTKAVGTMYSGRAGARNSRSLARPGRLVLARDQVCDEALVRRGVLARQHDRRLSTAGCCASAASISPSSMRKPRILTWVSSAAHEVERAVGPPAHQVARAVEALAGGAEGVGDEALGGELGPVQVAPREALAAHVELARHPGRHRPTPRVEHVHPGVANGPADGNGARTGVQVARDRVDRGEGRALGRTVPVEERACRGARRGPAARGPRRAPRPRSAAGAPPGDTPGSSSTKALKRLDVSQSVFTPWRRMAAASPCAVGTESG